MTDIMKLAKAWVESSVSPNDQAYENARAALQSAIEALQAENERLKALPMKYKRMEFNAQLQEENAALRAKLDELQKQEPVGYTDNTGIAFAVKWSGELPPNLTLYAAPKAQEPLTPQRIQEIHEQVLSEPIRTSGFFESFTRAVEAAHGITKGTP